jgi:hypothetical protein
MFFWSLFFLPIAVIIFLAWLFFIPLPIYDYWDVLYGGLHMQEKTFLEQLRFYWEPFVDQKMFFSKLLITYLAKVTHNSHYWLEIIFGLLGQFSVLSVVIYLIGKIRSLTPRTRSALILTSSFLLFWPNLLVRFQHHWYSTQYTFVLVFAALSILFIVRFWGRWSGVCLSLIFGFLSAISHGTGLIYLLSYMVLMSLASGWSTSQKLISFLGALGTILLVVAQMPDRGSINLPPLNWFTENPTQELIFILRCFGPERVLRNQTGLFTLVLGLYACSLLFVKKELFTRENFSWVLIFFWGCCAAGISGITRSSFAKYPAGIYFSFFILVMIAVIVLTAIAYPKSPLKNRKINWKIAGTVLAIFYIVGSVEGIRHAAKTQKRVSWSRERLQFQPILVQNDYRWLFPANRIINTISKLHTSNMLEDADARPFTINREVHFRKQMESQGVHYYIPDRTLSPNEVITFPVSAFANLPARCYWTADSQWHEEQSQVLQLRPVNGKYWIIFRNREIPGFSEPIKKIKLIISGDLGSQDISNLPHPTVWQRKTTLE